MAYTAILTALGAEKLAQATTDNDAAAWSKIALGDGTVTDPATATALANQVYVGYITKLATDESVITATLIVPPAEGGFTVTEAGIFDDDGDLCVYAYLPATYKPTTDEASACSLTIRLKVSLGTESNVTLSVDTSETLATIEYVDTAVASKTTLGTARALITDLASTDSAYFDGSSDVSIGVTGILPVESGGTGASSLDDITVGYATTAATLSTTATVAVDLESEADAAFDGSSDVSIGVTGILPAEHGGTGESDLASVNVGSATALETPREMLVNLASADSTMFDGTADVAIGVIGVLPVANGGTGVSDISALVAYSATYDGEGNEISATYATVTDLSETTTTVYELSDTVSTVSDTVSTLSDTVSTAAETAATAAETAEEAQSTAASAVTSVETLETSLAYTITGEAIDADTYVTRTRLYLDEDASDSTNMPPLISYPAYFEVCISTGEPVLQAVVSNGVRYTRTGEYSDDSEYTFSEWSDGVPLVSEVSDSYTVNEAAAAHMETDNDVTVENGTEGTAWTKVVHCTADSPSVTAGDCWNWQDGEAPDLYTGGYLVCCWLGTAGVLAYINVSA